MIRLHYANRLENLIAPLTATVADQQLRQPLESVQIIVPNRAVEQFVRMRLSETMGVAANLEFPFLRRHLGRIVQRANPDVRVLDANGLQVALFECLRDSLHDDAPEELRAVRNYAETGSKTPIDVEFRFFQLSEQLARLFREYSITRRRMLGAWHKRAQAEEGPFEEVARWQRDLWHRVFGTDGCVRAQWLDGSGQRWMLLPDAFDTADSQGLKAAMGPVLHVFGLGYAGPAFVGMFARMGELADLHIYALNPCMEFWEDVDNPVGIARDSWVRRRQRLEADAENESDPFGLDVAGDNPALRLWARPGREYIRLLNELTDCDFDAHFIHPAEVAAPTLLQRLQESILVREPERRRGESDAAPVDDGSIRFLACPGVRRETEIVANAIWSLVRQGGTPNPPLRFHEIAVVMPDRAQDQYLPQLETVFSRLHQIPLNVVNRRFIAESRVAEAIDLLLRLPLERFTRTEMIRLLTHPAIAGGGSDANCERWPDWCARLGVFFGADKEDLEGTYLRGMDLFHWDQALKRLSLGVLMTGERAGEERFFSAPRDIEYLPLEVAQDEAASVARMVRVARGLLSEALEIRSCRLALGQWARLLSDLVLTYVNTNDAADEQVRDYCVEAIESIATEGIRSEAVPYRIACEFAAARIADVESRRGRFSERGVAAGSLSALRSIPFRVIFMLGMNEADFPERTRHDPIDLRLARRRAGDVTPTERDRYLFLETLLAARERIFISYVARDPRTGDPLEPGATIRELQFILRGYRGAQTVDRLTVNHPASRYDLRYFSDLDPKGAEHPELVSFDPEARRGARMTALRNNLRGHCGDHIGRGRLSPDEFSDDVRARLRASLRSIDPPSPAETRIGGVAELSLPLAALRKFLECPLQGAARYAMGMADDDEGASEEHRDEPIAQLALDRSILLRQAFRRSRGDRERAIEEYLRAFRVAQAHGRAPAGPFAAATQQTDRARLTGWIDQAKAAGIDNLAEWQDIHIGSGDEFAHADRLLPRIVLDVPSPGAEKGAAQTRVTVYGTAGFMSPGLDASIRCVLRQKAAAKDFLGLFLSAIALSAAGANPAKEFRAIVVGDSKARTPQNVRRFSPLPQAQARRYLAGLASDLLFGTNDYFLPIEAAEKIQSGQPANPIDVIEELRGNGQTRCSSDYGPVRNARTFDPPGNKEIKEIVERRFAPLLGIFATGR